ncbi:MAG: uroporphyrinogen decarboxylase family protein [Sedimentisphaeraceae bacterium JB056]
MAQTSREVVRKTLKFDCPDRIARHTWVLPWATDNYKEDIKRLATEYPDDIVTAPNVYNKSSIVKGDPYEIGVYIDEWGCEFENIHKGIIGEVKKPAIEDPKDLPGLHCPYDILPENKEQAKKKVNDFCASTDKFVMAGCCPRPWERLQFLRGTVNAMMDIMMPDSGVKELINEIHKFYMAELEFWVDTDVDALMFMDDWGSQTSLLIPPPLWEDIFKPLYKDYCDIAHKNGKFIMMHSDGCITAIYPHLIEIGVDAVNSQLFCMDMDELAKIAKGKITFWGEIDRQHVMPSDNVQDAIDAVDKVASFLYQPSGGVIAQFEVGPGTNIENAFAVHRRWQQIAENK